MTPKSKVPHPDHPSAGAPQAAPGSAASTPRVLDSSELLGEQGEVLIRHDGRLYRLRRTRLGKLILTA